MTCFVRKRSTQLARALLWLLIVMAAKSLLAQTAHLSGEITDQHGALVPDALITVRNQATGIHRETRSTQTGTYDVTAIDPGTYTVRVMKQGFRTVERRGLELFVDTNTRVDFRLDVGSASDTVTVTADAPLTQPNTPENATEVNEQEYNDLPLLQQGRIRSPAAFIFLAPSVQGNYTLAGAENTAATNQFIVNGSQMQVTEFFLEGAQVGQMRTVGSFNDSSPAVDAIQQFKITTTMLPAEYGHSGPAAGIFSVKSGTNRFKGSLYGYFRNSVFDAKPWGTVIPTFTRLYEFGATIGGPVILPGYNGHNKTFFFFSYGGGRKSASDSVQDLRVPTPAQISGVFDPTKYYAVYDPASTSPNSSGGYTRTQVSYKGTPNVIPPNELDPVAKAIASFFPAPNLNTTSVNDYQGIIGELLLNPDLYTAKVDHEIDHRNHISTTFVATYIPRNKVSTGLPFPLNSSSYQTVQGRTARIDYDHVFRGQRVNSLILGFNRFVNVEKPPVGDEYPIPGLPGTILPEITFTQGYPNFAADGNFHDIENNYQVRDVFRWQIRNHNVSFGGELRNIQFNDTSPGTPQTAINISQLETNLPPTTPGGSPAAKTGDAFASFLLGQVDSATVTYPYEVGTRYRYSGFFMQDDWKILPRLTFNLGLRWDFQTFPSEAHNRSSILSLSTPNPGAIDAGGVPLNGALIFAGSGPQGAGVTSFATASFNAIGPRFGFAYQITSGTVVRGGYGIFYSDTGNSISAAGFQAAGNIQSPNNGAYPAFVLSAGLPSLTGLQPTLSSTLLNATNFAGNPQSASYIGPRAAEMPRIQEWTFGIQQAIGKSWLVEADYVGSKGTRLIDPYAVNINQLDPKYLSLGATLFDPLSQVDGQIMSLADGQSVLLKSPYASFESTGKYATVFQALRPYPQYNTLTSLAAKYGYNIYHSGQLILNKRYSYGLTIGGNFVWSKNLGLSSPGTYGGGVVNNALQNAYNPRAEYSILPIDVAKALVLHYTYEFPFTRFHRLTRGQTFFGQFANATGDGWKISAAQRYQSGYPLPILMSNTLGIGNYVLRPNIVPGTDPASHKSIHGFDPLTDSIINAAAFSTPAPYTFGNARPTYGDLRNFPILNEDFTLTKETRLRGRLDWNLYLQAFNAFNRHRFTAFDTNFSDAAFGMATVPSQPRYVQIGTRFLF